MLSRKPDLISVKIQGRLKTQDQSFLSLRLVSKLRAFLLTQQSQSYTSFFNFVNDNKVLAHYGAGSTGNSPNSGHQSKQVSSLELRT